MPTTRPICLAVSWRWAGARRRSGDGEALPAEPGLAPERLAALEEAEDFILSVADDGFGKRSSAYEYRITNRGGKGIDNMDLGRGNGRGSNARVVAAFPVKDQDQIMLVTDGGRLIRLPVADIRIAGRTTRGVTLFRVDADERIVSVTRLAEVTEQNGNGAAEAPEGAATDAEEGDGPADE